MTNEEELVRTKTKLLRMELLVVALPDSETKTVLLREMKEAQLLIDKGDPSYANAICKELRSFIRGLRLRSFFVSQTGTSNIQLIFSGILIYSFIVLLIGICAIIVDQYRVNPTSGLIKVVDGIGLNPLFSTVTGLGIQPMSYLIGLFGAAGAVVSLVKRFDEFEQKKGSPWLFFSIGLFSPIAGSLAAVVICKFVSAGLVENYKEVPLIAVAFFAGFSERLLNKVDSKL